MNTPAAPDAQEPPCQLTATQDLMMDCLAANRRLGNHLVLVETRHRKTLGRLAGLGLIAHEEGSSVYGTDKVFLTPAGMVYAMDPTYTPPVLRPECSSWYMGPITNEHRIECDRRNHHKGQHKGTWYRRKNPKTGPAKVVPFKVTWPASESAGRDSERYGAEMRRIDAQFGAEIAEARVRFRKPTPDPAVNPLS